jgi:hypothetical protein
MHPRRFNVVLLLCLLISSCNVRTNQISLAAGIASPTPFQPFNDYASNSPYTGAAPTPVYLPSVTPVLPTPTLPVTQTTTPAVEATVPQFATPGQLDPLTGLLVEPSMLNRRPLAVKVANYPRYVRPQMGLTLADHVYEYYIEEGLTRFVAIFYGSNPEWIGPVRSGRFFDENVQRMYQAFLIFKFADPRVLDYFKASDFSQFVVVPTNQNCPPFKFLPTRHIEVYNNSYFYTPEWNDCITEKDLNNTPPMLRAGFYSDLPPQTELQGNLIRTYYSVYSYNYWQYFPETKQYIRYQEVDDTLNGKPEKYELLLDAATSTTVHASNVVVLFAPHTFANTFDAEDEVYHIDLTGSGEAYVFRDGIGVVARWHRSSQDQPLQLATPYGTIIYLRPGITFYEVVGSQSYVDQGEGEWNFHHDTP